MSKHQTKDYDTKDTTGRCQDDAMLREHGFTILSRPERGPVLWQRNGRTYTEDAARKVADLLAEKKG